MFNPDAMPYPANFIEVIPARRMDLRTLEPHGCGAWSVQGRIQSVSAFPYAGPVYWLDTDRVRIGAGEPQLQKDCSVRVCYRSAMQGARWQQQLRDVIRDPQHLLEKSNIKLSPAALPVGALASFPVKVPRAWQERIMAGDANDPLLRQVLPLAGEDQDMAGYSTDPLGEVDKTAVPGLVRKYNGRALLITTSVCAIHCRYCFRRHYPYADNNPARENWSAAIDYIRADETLREVILSGGDPLSLADDRLQALIVQLESIPHLRWLRIHTRMPVALPARVTTELVNALTTNRFVQTMVIHANHPQEIDADVASALEKLHRAGVQLLNQSVLLKGVNDDARVLEQLSERLYAYHVLPYYLHMLDRVSGAAHFEVDETTARTLIEALRQHLPGYLVPRLVREIEGAAYKIPVPNTPA